MKNEIGFLLKRASSAQHLPAYKIISNVQIAKAKHVSPQDGDLSEANN